MWRLLPGTELPRGFSATPCATLISTPSTCCFQSILPSGQRDGRYVQLRGQNRIKATRRNEAAIETSRKMRRNHLVPSTFGRMGYQPIGLGTTAALDTMSARNRRSRPLLEGKRTFQHGGGCGSRFLLPLKQERCEHDGHDPYGDVDDFVEGTAVVAIEEHFQRTQQGPRQVGSSGSGGDGVARHTEERAGCSKAFAQPGTRRCPRYLSHGAAGMTTRHVRWRERWQRGYMATHLAAHDEGQGDEQPGEVWSDSKSGRSVSDDISARPAEKVVQNLGDQSDGNGRGDIFAASSESSRKQDPVEVPVHVPARISEIVPTRQDGVGDISQKSAAVDEIDAALAGSEFADMDMSPVSESYERGRWLMGLLVLQSTSSFVLDQYQDLLRDHVVVTLFLTMLVGAGGNAGNQSAIKVIRGLATGHFTADAACAFRVIGKQAVVGLILGTALALGGYARVWVTDGTTSSDAGAIAVSLFLIVVTSVLLGSALPFGFARAGIDPAHAGTTIQVAMDIVGVAVTCVTCSLVLTQLDQALSVAITPV